MLTAAFVFGILFFLYIALVSFFFFVESGIKNVIPRELCVLPMSTFILSLLFIAGLTYAIAVVNR